MSDGVQIFNATGHLVYANQAAANAFGYDSPDSYLKCQHGRPYQSGIVFCDEAGQPLERVQMPCALALSGRPHQAFVIRYVDHQHRDRRCTVKTRAIRDESNNILYGLVILHDVTELHSVQQTLKETNHRLQQVADAVPSMIASLDEREHHRYANTAYLKGLGKSREAVQGGSLLQVLGPVIYQQLQEAIHRAQTGETAELCLMLQTMPQGAQYKHVSVIPQYHGTAVEGFYLVLNDITAHKHTTDLLRSQTDFFRHALESAVVGIWEWNLDDDEMMWSLQQEQLFGLLPGSFDGNPDTFFELVAPSDREDLQQAIATCLLHHHALSIEFRVPLRDGTVRWLSHRGQVLLDSGGNPTRLAGVAFDITIQKSAEERLRNQIKRAQLLAKVSQEISRLQNLKRILQQVVREVRLFLGVDRLVIIDLKDKMAGEVTYEDHSADVESMMGWKLRHTWVVKEKFLAKYRQGYPIAVNNIHTQQLDETELTFLEYFQISADLTIPLLENTELWGLLAAHHSEPREWQPEDRRLLETLGTQISTAIQRDRLHQHLTQANEKLRRYAYLDGLTQVANRRRFEQFLSDEWRRLMREQLPLALIMADIDHFKAYNDIYGHQAGDECLRRVAGTLRSAIHRPADMVARYGGEEFVLVLPNTDIEGAEIVAEKIRTQVRSQKIPHRGSTSDRIVTISLGVAVIYPHPLKSPDRLIKAADQALYQAKHEGRDRVVTRSIT